MKHREPRLPQQTEKEFQAQVGQLLTLCGWRWFHPYDSRKSREGFPDITAVHGKRHHLLFAELKAEGKNPTLAQQAWLDDLAVVEVVTSHLWRPSDFEALKEIIQG